MDRPGFHECASDGRHPAVSALCDRRYREIWIMSTPADETLMNVVALIANRFNTDVCSAYLLEPDRANLVLAASLGLRPQCIGTLRMPLHEGLAGLVAEEVRPVATEQVKSHP